MSPEKRVDQINTDNLNHSGNLEGAMREDGLPGAESIQDVSTGEIEQVGEQFDHSGRVVLSDAERPEFQEKLAELRASHNTSEYTPVETVATPATPEQQSHTGRNLALVAAGLVTATGAVLAVNAVNNHPTTPEAQPQQSGPAKAGQGIESTPASAPASPLASPANTVPLETAPATTDKEALIKSHEIKAGQTDEQTSADIIKVISDWGMAGANADAFNKWTDSYNQSSPLFGKTVDEIAASIAAEQRAIYAPALFGSDYESDPKNKDVVDTLTQLNAKNISLYLHTYNSQYNSKNKEPWNRKLVFTKVYGSANDAAGRKITMGYTYQTNADKNSVGSDPLNGTEEAFTTILKKQGDTLELTVPKFDNILK